MPRTKEGWEPLFYVYQKSRMCFQKKFRTFFETSKNTKAHETIFQVWILRFSTTNNVNTLITFYKTFHKRFFTPTDETCSSKIFRNNFNKKTTISAHYQKCFGITTVKQNWTFFYNYRRPSLFAVLLFTVSTTHGLKNRE